MTFHESSLLTDGRLLASSITADWVMYKCFNAVSVYLASAHVTEVTTGHKTINVKPCSIKYFQNDVEKLSSARRAENAKVAFALRLDTMS